MPRFRRKPLETDAWQYFPGGNTPGVCRCMSDECGSAPHLHQGHPERAAVRLDPGDWIIPEADGRGFGKCRPDVFAITYEPVEGKAVSEGPDTLNRFAVGALSATGDIVIGCLPPPGYALTPEEALNLAAYLAACADPGGERFRAVLEAVKNA